MSSPNPTPTTAAGGGRAGGPAAAPAPGANPPASSTAAAAAGASTATTAATTTTKKTKKAAGTKATKKKPAKASGAGTQAKAKKPARKKKATTATSNAAANAAILQEARAAAADLAAQRAHAAARKADPLWYRIEDVVPAVLIRESEEQALQQKVSSTAKKAQLAVPPTATATQFNSATLTPNIRDQVAILERALGHNGMTRSDVTPQAMACLLEYSRRYASELLSQAELYASHADRGNIQTKDLLLAAEMRQDHPVSISTQLPMIHALSQQLNRKPLPPIPANCYSGILLPPPTHQVTARTFDVISGAATALRTTSKYPAAPPPSVTPTPPGSAEASKTTATAIDASGKKPKTAESSQPSYGASRGRQIQVKLKEKEQTPAQQKPPSNNPSAKTTGVAAVASAAASSTETTTPKAAAGTATTSTVTTATTTTPVAASSAATGGTANTAAAPSSSSGPEKMDTT